jgi:cell division protein FtsI (penicillin-binding protein 3)
LIALLVVFVVVGASFVAVLVDLQTVRADRYRSLGEDQRTRTRTIAGYRGAILDRNGFVLAASTPSHQIVADPTLVDAPEATAELLSPILGVDVPILTEALTPEFEDDRFSLLARTVDDEAVTQIQELEETDDGADALSGIAIRPEEDRVYPAGDLATAVIGRVDPYEQGIFGVEAEFNEQMTGIPGTEQYERGRFGTISVGDWKVDPATSGDTVVLTIDHRIQYVAEQTLLTHCQASGAQGMTAAMSDPSTGEILAMASVTRDEGDRCVVAGYNKAVVDTFEPGSVMKPIVVSAVSEELGYQSDTTIDVPGRISIGGKSFVDHPMHATAPFPVSQILSDSMNVGTIMLSQQIPAETYHDYLLRFGFARSTGLPVEGEGAGSVRHPDDWWGSDYGSIPIGQGLTINATQLLTAYGAIANDGVLLPPILVRSLEGADGSSETVTAGEPQVVVSPGAANEVTESLVAVVDHGTGTPAAVSGFTVAGKTGTAWKVYDDGTGTLTYGSAGNRRYVLSFVGFLPADTPEIALVVVVDEPEATNVLGEATASEVAAPIFGEIADYAARILDLPPEDLDEVASGDDRVRAEPAADPLAPTLPASAGATVSGGAAQEEAAGTAAGPESDESE